VAEIKKHSEKHAEEHAEEHGHGAGRYVVIWAALLVFTFTTVITGRMDLGGANLPLAMVIATVKASLVVLFFMHLWNAEGILRLVFGVSIVFVIVLLLGVFGDILTRMPEALPSAANHTAIYKGKGAPGAEPSGQATPAKPE
jgi:cytochrome c oxidase subunit 4